jgi:alpha-glucosidase
MEALLEAAIKNGRWVNTYAETNIWEYWAEGVQSWFNVNAEVDNDGGDGKHNKVNTREELKVYDPGLYQILSEYFPETDKRISRHKKENLYNWENIGK